MYLPPDLGRYSKPPPNQFQSVLNGNILPIQATDPNCMFRLNEDEFNFDNLDGTFRTDVTIRISRTPLLAGDPSTYASLSKFVEQNLRKYHTTLGNINQNQLVNPLSLPPETVGVQPDGKTEVLPVGCAINPLTADPFKNVHLTPGCTATIIAFRGAGGRVAGNANTDSSGSAGKLWMRSRSLRHEPVALADGLRLPKSNLARSASTFIAKVLTADNFNRKLANANTLLVGCHGRIVNVLVLEDNPKDMEIEVPLLRVIFTSSIVTAFSTFDYTTPAGEKNLDIVVGFASGDIVWINATKGKYARWNKNAKLKAKPIISLEWAPCGSFVFAGFSDGEVMVFHRDFEDDDFYKGNPATVDKSRYIRVFRSAKRKSPATANPIVHFKISNKAVTSIKFHPQHPNIAILAADDGYLRVFDLLNESFLDIMPSFYGGFLSMNITQDGKYLVAGGEDDLVSIYEFQYGGSSVPAETGFLRLVARLEGARSWVRSIEVDYFKTTTGLLYRIGTVGDDGAIRFYEFQPRNLPKVKKPHPVKPAFEKQKSMLTISSHNNSSLRLSGLALDNWKKRQHLTSRFHKNSESISSLTSSTQMQHHLSLYEIINQDSTDGGINSTISKDAIGNGNVAGQWTENLLVKASPDNLQASAGLPVLHSVTKLRDCPILYPIGEKDLTLGRLSGLHFEKKYVWAFVSTGELVRWKRP